MSVTINELQVDVQESPAAQTPQQAEPAKKELSLWEALEVLRERDLRLRAD